MARLLSPANWLAYTVSGNRLRAAVGALATVYADAAGTTLANIAAYDGSNTPGAVIAGSVLTIDSNSLPPRFWFPDGVKVVWISIGGGPLTAVYADSNARSELGIYVPPGWGANWRSKLAAAKAGTGKAVIAAIGSSSTQGYYASNLRSKGWVDLLRSSLQASYGDGGSGFRTSSLTALFQGSHSIPSSATTVYNANGNLAVLGGTWSESGNNYGPGNYYVFTQAAGATWTLAAVRGTTIKIYTVGGGTNHTTFSYAIDGGAPVTVTDIGGAQQIQVTTITGLTAGNHQVVLTFNGDTTKFVSVCGVAGENASGVIVNNLARYGTRAEDYGNVDQALSAPWNGGASYPADLVLLAHAPNDAVNGDSGDKWAQMQRRIMATVREANSAADLMIVLPHVGKHDASTNLYQDYASRARGLAEAFGVALVDFWTLGRNSWNYWNGLGYWADANNPGAAGTDTIHPSDAGHQAIANVLLPLLTG